MATPALIPLVLACFVGLMAAMVDANVPYYPTPPTPKTPPPPPPPKKTPPPPPPPKKTPPPPPPKKTPPPPPPKKSPPPKKTPPPHPPKKTPPPPKKTPPPPPPKKTPPPPPTHTPPPPYYHTPPPPPPPTSTPPPPSVPTPTPPTLTPPPPSVPTPTPPTLTPPPPSVPTPTPPTPNPPPIVDGKVVYCQNPSYTNCYRVPLRCPSDCLDTCEVDCNACKPVCNCNRPGAVCQDPRFVGADGIAFYFHGKKDQDFCIVSDSNLHINAHFIGRRNENMQRDFTWVQALGILFDNHQIFVGAKKTATWDNAIDRLELQFDGSPFELPEGEGEKWQSRTGISMTRSRDTNAVVIEVEGNFQIRATVVPITKTESRVHRYGITDEDCFAHLDLSFKFYSLTGNVNGVLGQTYSGNYTSRVKMGIEMPVLGGQREFASTDLFSTDCSVARFTGTSSWDSPNNFEFANLNCASGLDGHGVVCKR